MATRAKVSGPTIPFPRNNKLQNKINLLGEVIEREKMEVRKIGKKMRDLIERKENEVIKELEAIWEGVRIKIENEKKEAQKTIDAIETHAQEISSLLKKSKHTQSPQLLTEIDKEMESVRDIDIPIPYVQLTWRLDELRESINAMCRCEQEFLEESHQLKWSTCERGEGDTQLYTPCGIAINSVSGNIYVADNWKHRVQILSQREMNDLQMVKPENILLRKESIYKQCDTRILKFNASTEKLEKSKLYDFSLRGICTDNVLIYVGNYRGMKLINLTCDLTREKEIKLWSKYCKQYITKIRDVSLAQNVFYVLFSDTDNPIQAFSKEGIVTRCVIQKDSITNAYFFCLDQQLNLIVSDTESLKLRYSPTMEIFLVGYSGQEC